MRNKEGMRIEVGTIGINEDIKTIDLIWDSSNPSAMAQYRFDNDQQIYNLIEVLETLVSKDTAKYPTDDEQGLQRLSRTIMMDTIYGPEKGRQMRIEELRKQGRWIDDE